MDQQVSTIVDEWEDVLPPKVGLEGDITINYITSESGKGKLHITLRPELLAKIGWAKGDNIKVQAAYKDGAQRVRLIKHPTGLYKLADKRGSLSLGIPETDWMPIADQGKEVIEDYAFNNDLNALTLTLPSVYHPRGQQDLAKKKAEVQKIKEQREKEKVEGKTNAHDFLKKTSLLQIDPEMEGNTLVSSHGSAVLPEQAARVVGYILKQQTQGKIHPLEEIHKYRFQEKSGIYKVEDTESWLIKMNSTVLSQVKMQFIIRGGHVLLDRAG